MNAVVKELMNDEEANPSPTLILRELEVFNWGAFEGLHRAEIDERGTAIIGPTGSGKTTLVDALMTLITAQPKYNLASTGGHESDRDLISYVRGVSGAGNNSGDNSHVARPDKTVTGISARFASGSQSVTVGAVLWIDGTSSAAADLKRSWIFSRRDDQSLETWLSIHNDGGARALNQLGREAERLLVSPSKKVYLAELRRFFEVGENAFTLLNRAAGLKQLNSIDEIFRELVLDDHSAFERAAEVVAEFDDLAAIHAELETARRQQQSLLPIERTNNEYLDCQQLLKEQQELLRVLPVHFATVGYRLWGEVGTKLDAEIDDLSRRIDPHEKEAATLAARAATLNEIYLKAGGAGVKQLEEQIRTQETLTEERRRQATDYRKLTGALGLDTTLSRDVLLANQRQIQARQQALEQQKEQEEAAALRLGAKALDAEEKAKSLRSELQKVKARPSSNIPGNYQDFRSDLATELGLPEEQLPFVAELVEVKAEEGEWRGAIERAIGSHRLRILVPSGSIGPALAWVNQRDNRLHVRLWEAKANPGPANFFEDGFTRKLNFKVHPHRGPLKALVAAIDRHCVGSPEQLRETPRGMTAQGLMSGSRGLFEKQDQTPLDQGWITGFDNRDRLAELGRELAIAEKEKQESAGAYSEAKQRETNTSGTLAQLEVLARVEFHFIDLPAAETALDVLRQRLEVLMDPNSSVAKAKREFDDAEEQLGKVRTVIKELENQRIRLDERRKTVRENQRKAFERIGEGLADEQQKLVDEYLPLPDANVERLDELERGERQRIASLVDASEKRKGQLQQKLVRQMVEAKNIDTGSLCEAGTEIPDIPHYLDRLRVLNEEALPEKLNRFVSYLNQSSDQGVTQLLAGIDNEVTLIEERIADLNKTLRQVDFQPGRYLRLEPRHVVHESLRTLQNAQRHLRSAALKDDDGESHYKALAELVKLLRDAADSKRTVGARALLDPRYRLQFVVAVVDRATDGVIEIRTGSQGGSGGEKEIIASYILTASLSYALCPEGSTRPLFGTIVLDEAFSKSSQAVGGRIISALREFGLHPLFVTPNKEMRLLRSHTRSAVLVHRKAMRATLTSLSWEELEAHAQSKLRV